MVERLESDLGVRVEEVNFPELQYSTRIWMTYMSLPDDDGKVGPDDKSCFSSERSRLQDSSLFKSFDIFAAASSTVH